MDDFIKTADNPCDEAILAIKAIRGRYVPIDEKFLDSFEITYDTWTLTIEALELYKIVKRPNPDDLTETAIAQLAYDIERINTLRGDEWDYEPGAEEMRKELSAKYGHAINALLDYNKTVTVTWEGDPDDCPSAICSGCDSDLAEYDWYDKLVFGPRNYCPYCGGRIVKQITEEYTGEDEWEEEV